MSEEIVQVTQELIRQGQSGAGGWNRKQIEILKVPWPPRHGWRRRAEGTWIPKADAERFVALKGMTQRKCKKSQQLCELLLNFDAD